jgi:drug/metabolite transporter (DMT)-like permease
MAKIVVFLYIVATSLALIILKLGSKGGAPLHYVDNKLHFNINPYNLTGVLCYGGSFLLYVYLISKYDLGYIIPLTTGLVYVLICAASFVIFKEVFTVTKLSGIVLIIVGVALLNLNR